MIAVYPGSFDPLTIAHLAVAEAAVSQLGVARVVLALSTVTLGKDHLGSDDTHRRARAARRTVEPLDWLEVSVVEQSLVADIAQGYDVVLMGADKWAQVNDVSWYGGDVARRDEALARLPRVAVAPRDGYDVPEELRLRVDAHLGEVSASAVRAGRTEWAAAQHLREA